MRILFISSSYPPVLGGLQTTVHAIATGLRTRGHAVEVVANRTPRRLSALEELDGIPVHRLTFLQPRARHLINLRPDLFLAGCWYAFASRVTLLRIVRRFRPDVLHLHYPDQQTPFVLWLLRRVHVPLVISLHGDEVERWFDDRGELIASLPSALVLLLRAARAVTAPSRYLFDRAARIEPSVSAKAHVIPNGIFPSRFADSSAFAHPHPYILAFGRLDHNKGFHILLNALARVIPDFPEAHLLLAGEGEAERSLHEQTLQRRLDANVRFLGRASPEQIVQLLNGCQFVVLPSLRESFGIAALEALAAGKPVLATDVGGMGEFLRSWPSESISLVEPSVESLETGLRRWLAHQPPPLPVELRRRVLAEYDRKSIISLYEELF